VKVETIDLEKIESVLNIKVVEDTFFVIEPVNKDAVRTVNISFSKSKKEIKLVLASKIANAKVDLSINVIHQKEETRSNLQIRTILEDGARFKFSGNVRVTETASNCRGNIEIKALVTGENISWNVEPSLEISNKYIDVQHKASMITFNKNQIIYLKLRGFTEEEATKVLKKGFLLEETGKIPEIKIKNNIMRKLKV